MMSRMTSIILLRFMRRNRTGSFFGLIILALLLVFTSSCKKRTENTMVDYSYGVKVSGDYALAQHFSISLANTYFKCIYDSALMEGGHSIIDAANVYYSVDSVCQLKIIYPEWGANDGYGNWRQGEVHIKADGGFFNTAQDVEFVFDKFNFRKDTLTAHKYSIKYMGGSLFQLLAEDVSISMEDTTGIITFNSVQQFDVELGAGNWPEPQSLSISGIFNGTTRFGEPFETNASGAIKSDLVCNWMKEGAVDISFANVGYQGLINFNEPSECENRYMLIIDDLHFPSKIRKPKWQ